MTSKDSDNSDIEFIVEVPKKRKINGDNENQNGQTTSKKTKPKDDNNETNTKFNLNPLYNTKLNELKQLYHNKLEMECCNILKENVNLINQPFKVMQLHNLIEDESNLKDILDRASQLNLIEKNSDLLWLKQSKDLNYYKKFMDITQFFGNKVKKLLEEVTGLELNNKVALNFSKYETNNYLLCHDDRLENRKIAFILYLVHNDWSEEDGGLLQLFSVDQNGKPNAVVKNVVPKLNTMVFFEVNPTTYHQVSEVLTDRSSRWSINGWFHSDTIDDNSIIYPSLTFTSLPLTNYRPNTDDQELQDKLFLEWLNPSYLDPSSRNEVRNTFAENSEIQLKNFINTRKQKAIEDALKSVDNIEGIWKEHYSPLFGRVEYLDPIDDERWPDALKEYFNILKSDHFFKFVRKLTKAPIARSSSSKTNNNSSSVDNNANNYKVRIGIFRWKYGFYTLASDINPEIKEKALDIDMFFNVKVADEKIIELSDDGSDDDDDDDDDGNIVDSDTKTDEPSVSNNNRSIIEVINLDDNDDDQDDNEDESDTISIDSDDNSADFVDCGEDEAEEHNLDSGSILTGGGYLVYVANSCDRQLLDLEPNNKVMNIIFRKYHCQRFMKYIDKRNTNVPFHHIQVVFISDEESSNK